MKTNRHFYALVYSSDFALNDSIEKIKYWGTASVYAFRSKADRDQFCDGHYLRHPISHSLAHSIGVSSYFANKEEAELDEEYGMYDYV